MSQKTWLSYLLYFLLVAGLLMFETACGVAPHHYFQPAVRYIYATYNFTIDTADSLYQSFADRRLLLEKLDRFEDLKTEYHRLKTDKNRLRADNRRLRRQLDLPAPGFGRLVAAEVIQKNLSGWEQVIRLNKGYNSGLQAGGAVFRTRGDSWILQGRIHGVNSTTSKVILSTDPRFKIGAKIEGIPDRQFVLQGEGHRKLKISNFPEYLSLSSGQKVYSASGSSFAPSRLLVGYVEEIKSVSDFRPVREVLVTPVKYEQFPSLLWVLIDDV